MALIGVQTGNRIRQSPGASRADNEMCKCLSARANVRERTAGELPSKTAITKFFEWWRLSGPSTEPHRNGKNVSRCFCSLIPSLIVWVCDVTKGRFRSLIYLYCLHCPRRGVGCNFILLQAVFDPLRKQFGLVFLGLILLVKFLKMMLSFCCHTVERRKIKMNERNEK